MEVKTELHDDWPTEASLDEEEEIQTKDKFLKNEEQESDSERMSCYSSFSDQKDAKSLLPVVKSEELKSEQTSPFPLPENDDKRQIGILQTLKTLKTEEESTSLSDAHFTHPKNDVFFKDNKNFNEFLKNEELELDEEAFMVIWVSSKNEESRMEHYPVEDLQLVKTREEEQDYDRKENEAAFVRAEDDSTSLQRVIVIAPLRVNVRFGPYKGKISEEQAAALVSSKAFIIYVMGSSRLQEMYEYGVRQEETWVSSQAKELVFKFNNEVASRILSELPDLRLKSLTAEKALILAKRLISSAHGGPPSFNNSRVGKAAVKCHTCDICQKSFAYQRDLKRHSDTHSKKAHSCLYCKKSFALVRYLKNHLRRCNQREKPCKKARSNSTSSRKKMTSRSQSVQKSQVYEKSSSPSTESSKPKIDVEMHFGLQSHTCDICGRSFAYLSKLKRHMRIHTGEKPHTCDVCQKSFSHLDHFKIHMRIHTGEKPYTCQVCAASFADSTRLRAHSRIHTGDTLFTCTVCQKTFTQKSNLTVHMRMHTGCTPFHCEVCQKKFTQKSSLTVHMRKHTGCTPFHCEVCQKKFTQKSSLTVHMRKHASEEPFSCEVCQRTYLYKSSLRTHMKTHA